MGLSAHTIFHAKRLKTIELQYNLSLILKLSQGNLRGQCQLVKRHRNDTGVSIGHRRIGSFVRFQGTRSRVQEPTLASALKPASEERKDRFFSALYRDH